MSRMRRKADLHRHSLEKELRAILKTESHESAAERIDLSRQVRSMTPDDQSQTDSATLIRQDRDSR